MPKLHFIIGSSGVGKSTLVPLLKSSLPKDFDIHDFDEKLTKEVALNNALLDSWRKEATEFWIRKAEENAVSGKSTVILGLVYPKEALEIETDIPMSFILLDASDEKIRERLMGKRFSTPEKVLGLKQATRQTPEEFLRDNQELMDRLRRETAVAGGAIIDTTEDTPKETTRKVIERFIL